MAAVDAMVGASIPFSDPVSRTRNRHPSISAKSMEK